MTGPEAKERRLKIGRTQTQWWGALGVPQETGSRYEHGRPMPQTVKLLLVIAHGSSEQSRKVVAEMRK